jgi:hypothetical protein
MKQPALQYPAFPPDYHPNVFQAFLGASEAVTGLIAKHGRKPTLAEVEEWFAISMRTARKDIRRMARWYAERMIDGPLTSGAPPIPEDELN